MKKQRGKMRKQIMAVVLSVAMMVSNLSVAAAEQPEVVATEAVTVVDETSVTVETSSAVETESNATESSSTVVIEDQEVATTAQTPQETSASEESTTQTTESVVEEETVKESSEEEVSSSVEEGTTTVETTVEATEVETSEEETTEEETTEEETEVAVMTMRSSTATSVLDTSTLPTVAQGAKAEGEALSDLGSDGRFTILFGSGSSIDENSKTFEDGLSASKRVNFRTNASTTKGSIKFTTDNAATLKIYWVSGGDGRQMTILDESGAAVATSSEVSVKNSLYITELKVLAAGTYFLGGDINSNYVYHLELTEEAASGDDNQDDGKDDTSDSTDTVEVTTVYDFTDGSIIPNDTALNGTETITSADKKLTVSCGNSQNGYGYNGVQHGSILKAGNIITIAVPEKAKIIVAGCNFSKSNVTFTMEGTDLNDSVYTKTAGCYHNDKSSFTYDYEGPAGTLVLTFDGTTYIPSITVVRTEKKQPVEMIEVTTEYNFMDGSIIPNDTTLNGTETITSADKKLTVSCGNSQNGYGYNGVQHGSILKAGNIITIAVPEKAKIIVAGCNYSKSNVTFTMEGTDLNDSVYTKTAGCYHNDKSSFTYDYEGPAGTLVLTFDGTTYIPMITVVRTEPKPEKTEVTANVTIVDENDLLGNSKVLLVNKADAEDVVDATAGGNVTVKVNATYEVQTDNADIEAKIGNVKTFATSTEDVEVEITILSTVIHPVVSIVDQANVLGDATLTLTNNADSTDVVTLKDGKSAKLKIGATYLLACSEASITATIAGSKLFKAVDGVTEIQVDVTETDMSHHTVDVWDFGAEQLANTDTVTYNNKLTANVINSWYGADVEPGTKGVNIAAFEVKDEDGNLEIAFADGGKTTTHRLRTKNTDLTRYDEKSLTDLEDSNIIYNGYVYSNMSKTADAHFKVAAKAGDIFTFAVSSNGTSSDVTWTSPSGETDVQVFDAKSSYAQRMTFYAKEDGCYTLHSATEKIVVARIYRERPNTVTVSGDVTAPATADLSKASLEFTNQTTGVVTTAKIADGKYEVALSEQYAYAIKLVGANGYIVDENNVFSIKNEEGNKTFNVNVIAVDLVKVSGSLADLTTDDVKNLKLEFISEYVFIPELEINADDVTFTATFEKGVKYEVKESGVEDYTLETKTVQVSKDGTLDIKFAKKPVYDIDVTVKGVSAEEAKNIKFTFGRLNEEFTADGYVYSFTGTDGIALRDGQYKVVAELAGYTQALTADVKVKGEAQTITVVMENAQPVEVAYAAEITVGTNGDYKTVNEALEAVRNMKRENGERVVISIEPGNYEEMLVIDVENVTLKNASANPSIELTNKGVDIAENAVRITSYYGHGYTYYSMGSDCKYDEELLAVNKANGYPSFVNPGSGTTAGSYWNATVVVTASGFEADGIIFENSFNQYVSEKAANDVIVKQGSAKEGSVARADMKAGDVTVQNKAYVERAAAFAIYNNINDVVLDNCKFIGRQDTLYGGTNSYVEFNECSIYGGTDYIFGGMIAIFNKCDLVFNTSEDKNDVGYITAAQQKSGRGYLMYECHITSTTPGVDTASEYTSKPGYLGRPWQADTSEVIFYNTTIDAADAHWEGGSLINPVGWNNSLSGESVGMCEYGTLEKSGVDNSASRVSWATMLTSATLNDGTPITLEAFRREVPATGYYELDLTQGLTAGVVYDGGISVLEDMAFKSVTGDEIGGVVYEGYVAGKSNPKADGSNAVGTVPTTGSVVKLTAEKDGKVKFAIKLNAGKTAYFVDETATTPVEGIANSGSASAFLALSYEVESGHTYYFYGNGTKVPVYGITVDYREPEVWDKVATPVLGTPVVDNAAGTITVPYTAQVGGIYADAIDIKMFNANNDLVATLSSAAEANEGELVFTPSASGDYTFQAVLKRSGELNKTSVKTAAVNFILPMAQPVIINAENQGNGNVRFTWKAVAEAESYNVYLNGEKVSTVTEPVYRYTKLTVGQEYELAVEAVRGEDVSEKAIVKHTVTNEGVKNWAYAAFGSGVDTKNNYAKVNEDGSVTVASTNGKGKLVPASTDGLAFYYTTFDPENENFTLSADVTVDSWKYSNGQEGFGIMAADTVGEDGDASTFWNNSYMASVSKVEYYWDSITNSVSDAGAKYSMKLGVGSQEKIGATLENIAAGTTVDEFKSTMTTLDTSCAKKELGAGTYNIVGNFDDSIDAWGVNVGNQTTFRLEIQRNNTGYFVSYTDQAGNKTTKKYYHNDETGDELTQLDPNNIYVGFFASRNATITVSNVEITTIAPSEDAPAEERPITYVTPSYVIESAATSNTEEYELVYYGNADGTLKITDASGAVIADDVHVNAFEKYRVNTTLSLGLNKFVVEMTPDADYQPSKYERLSSYNTQKFGHIVLYSRYGVEGDTLYVSPNGKSSGTGSKKNPLDIYTAVKYVQPGQTIVIMEGTYRLSKTVTVDRGIDGTVDNMIKMVADPDASTRPVFDFQNQCAGMVFAGDYWYLEGFAVTRSANGQKGIQVSGSNNILDNLHAYDNGNTGIQISRFKGSDQWEDWPANNLILNCTSYLNADAGYEDADGFAAKLTVADGNVFDGCIAAYNADDGWDLFAKVESGPIGKVVIKNSIAFKNGYDIAADGTVVNAGNGNGFKMGGSSISGYHRLENSIAFANKCKGIDSNSCPDIQVVDCISFDNESYNVAFYTNDAKNTDFSATGVISYKVSNNVEDSFKLKGNQDESKVYGATNFYFNGSKSVNSANVAVDDSWFVNLDTEKAITGITRNANGTINMHGYLELTDKALAGGNIGGTESEDVEIGEETGGRIEGAIVAPVKPESSSSSSSSKPATTVKPVVTIPEVETPLAPMPGFGNILATTVNLTKEAKLQAELLQKYHGQNVYLMAHLGNGVGFTVNTAGVNAQAADLKLETKIEKVEKFAEGFDTVKLTAGSEAQLLFNIGVHTNVGVEYAGKTAYLFRKSLVTGQYELAKVMVVNEIGNVALETNEVSDIMILIAK